MLVNTRKRNKLRHTERSWPSSTMCYNTQYTSSVTEDALEVRVRMEPREPMDFIISLWRDLADVLALSSSSSLEDVSLFKALLTLFMV